MLPWIINLLSLVVLATVCVRNLRYGTYWVVLCLPFYEVGRIHIGPIPTTVVELNILLLFEWWTVSHISYLISHISKDTKNLKQIVNSLVTSYKSRVTRLFGSWFWLILAWLVVATFSMIISPNLREAVGTWKAFFIEPILFLVVFIDVIKKEHVMPVLNALITSGSIVAVIAIIQAFTGWWIENPFWAAEATRRVTSVFPFPNAVGLLLAPICVIAIALTVSYLPSCNHLVSGIRNYVLGLKNNRYTLYVIRYTMAASAMLLAILSARSRGALLGVACGILFLALFHKGKRIWYWTGIGVVTLIVLLSGTFAQLTTFFKHQPTSFSGGDSVNIRVEEWSEALTFVKDHPVLGAGLSGYQKAIAPYHSNSSVEIYKYPHNVFLNFWMELGIIGLLLFVWIIIKFYAARLRMHQYTNAPIDASLHSYIVALLASMTTLLVHGLVDVPYFKNDLSILFWIFIGLSIIITTNRITYTVLSITQKTGSLRADT